MNTKYWMKKKRIVSGVEIANNPPSDIIKPGSGWKKIEDPKEIIELFPLFVHQRLASELPLYDVWVHESDKAFSKGVYRKFIESAKNQLGDKYKAIMYDNEIKNSSSWFKIKKAIESELDIEIKENYADGCVIFPFELLNEIKEVTLKKKK